MAANRWPMADIDVAAELRRQLDEAIAKRGQLEHAISQRDGRIRQLERDVIPGLRAEADALRRTLLGEAELAEAQHEAAEKRGSGWWMAAWREVARHRSALNLRIGKLEQWLNETGSEATRMQSERDAARNEVGELTRQLDLAHEGDTPEQTADRIAAWLAAQPAVDWEERAAVVGLIRAGAWLEAEHGG